MSTIKLMGARPFISMPPGTFYVPYWLDQKSCLNIIENFPINPHDYLDMRELHVYGDNYGSMHFSDDEDDKIFYYDANVVGDASPTSTLYVVFEEDLIPDVVQIRSFNNYEETFTINKSEILSIKNKFACLPDFNPFDESGYAAKALLKYEQANATNRTIINTYIEVEILNRDLIRR